MNDNEDFVNAFLKIKPFKKEYGAYSEKAIKKLLAVMRIGTQWNEDDICEQTRNRIQSIINGDIDEKIKRTNGSHFQPIIRFSGTS